MKNLIYNEDDLKDNEIDEIVTRVKAFIINDNNEILIAKSDGRVQLLGGHVEPGESYEEAVVREIKEETGIYIEEHNISKPFFEIKHYTKNYNNSGKNRLSNVLYYYIKTNYKPDHSNINLTENVIKNIFLAIIFNKSI